MARKVEGRALSFSDLKRLEISYNAFANRPENKITEALVMGSCLDERLYEPEKFASRNESSVVTVTAKKFAEEMEEQGLVIPKGRKEEIIEAANIIQSHPAYNSIISDKGTPQTTLYGEYDDYEIKGRLDYLDIEKGIIIDLKTTSKSLSFIKDKTKWWLADTFYHVQLALYDKLVKQNYGDKPYKLYIVLYGWVEQDLLVFQLSDKTISEANEILSSWTDKITDTLDNNKFKGMQDNIIYI